MDQALLEQMTQIYMTDGICEAAVRSHQGKHGGTLVEAAQAVARTVVPAPHNAAAHDARYLLCPDSQQVDLEAEANDSWRLESRVDVSDPGERGRTDIPDVPPLPPHPLEAPDDRLVVDQSVTMTSQQYSDLPLTNAFLQHGEECGPICDLLNGLSQKIYAADRVAVRPPRFTFTPQVGGWRMRAKVETVPARGRLATFLAGWGDEEILEGAIAKLAGMVEDKPDHRLMVRRDPSENWATAVVFRPMHHDVFEGLPPEALNSMIEAIMAADRGELGDLVQAIEASGFQVVSSEPGLMVLSVIDGSGENSGPGVETPSPA